MEDLMSKNKEYAKCVSPGEEEYWGGVLE